MKRYPKIDCLFREVIDGDTHVIDMTMNTNIIIEHNGFVYCCKVDSMYSIDGSIGYEATLYHVTDALNKFHEYCLGMKRCYIPREEDRVF